MRIRDYRKTDAAALASILHSAVHEVGRRHYSAAQRAAWSPAPLPPERFHARVSDGRTVLVAVTPQDVPRAFIELEPDGHIDCFYCHPEVAGTGIGAALFARLQDRAVAAQLPRLTVEASEAARRFFLRAGFRLLRRREFELRGVPIHNYAMEKVLETRAARDRAGEGGAQRPRPWRPSGETR